MDNGQRARRDNLNIIIGVVIIIVSILLAIAIIAIVLRRSGFFDTPPPSPEDMIIQPEVWGIEEFVSSCTGYRIPPIDDTTPSNTVNYSANLPDSDPWPGGFSPCLWQDEINRRYEQATCLSDYCTDQYGITTTRGNIITYPTYCEVNNRCLGSLGVIAMSNNEVIDESDSGYGCLYSPIVGDLNMTTCSLFDPTQYFIMEPRSQDLQSIVRLRQRDASYTLTANSQDYIVLESNTLVTDGGYYWIVLPQYQVQQGNVTYSGPSQLGYIGRLPDSIVSDPTNYQSPTAIRNFMLMYGIKTIRNDLTLQDWYYEIADTELVDGERVYNTQSVAFTTINRMSDIPHLLA